MSRLVLPKTQQARNWVRSTDALRDHLKQRLATVRVRADQKRKEADEIEREGVQLEQAIQLLDQLLPPKTGSNQAIAALPAMTPAPADAPPIQGPSPITKRWSLMYDACRNCNRTSVKHLARGLCATCYTDQEIRARFGGGEPGSATA